jgi:hypothetical protein
MKRHTDKNPRKSNKRDTDKNKNKQTNKQIIKYPKIP